MKRKLIVIGIFNCLISLVIINGATAQNVNAQSTKWQAVQVTFLNDGRIEDNSSQFIIRPTTIEWIQKGGQKVYTFEITMVTGTWSDVTKDGSINYDLQLNGKQGSILIKKLNGLVTLKLTYRSGEPTGLSREYKISGFEIITQ